MQGLTALFLTLFFLFSLETQAQESIEDWSKKVILLQESQGQNFEQDLQLARGLLYLRRRKEALTLLTTLSKSGKRKDSRLIKLIDSASQQFFYQETAENYADSIQLVRDERWAEAKDKIELALQKEPQHLWLTLRAIQLGIILKQKSFLAEQIKVIESFYSEQKIWKTFDAFISLEQNETKEAYRKFSLLWISDKKLFDSSLVVAMAFQRAARLTKHFSEVTLLTQLIQSHAEWKLDQKSEKLKKLVENQEKEWSYFFNGLTLPEEKSEAVKTNEKD